MVEEYEKQNKKKSLDKSETISTVFPVDMSKMTNEQIIFFEKIYEINKGKMHDGEI